MLRANPDDRQEADFSALSAVKADSHVVRSTVVTDNAPLRTTQELADQTPARRRTPRLSLIVVLPENHVMSPDVLTESLRGRVDSHVDVLVACAGQPTNLGALQRSIGEAQFLLAPAGTSTEALRELAIRQAPGDIVRLVSGARFDSQVTEQERFMTS
ncbi:MAG TPA: hypothetical protein VGO75_05400 [Gemmatimonadaceae bacterium]|jgi:hypothetical protein|nr:hypothetical protein [Gemmatimonadaceae bacterium]